MVAFYAVRALWVALICWATISAEAKAWTLVGGATLPINTCNMFLYGSRIFIVGFTSGKPAAYELLVSPDGNKLGYTQIFDTDTVRFLGSIDGVVGRNYIYRRPVLENRLRIYYSFGDSIRLVSTDTTLQPDPPSITIAKPFSWQSQADYSFGIGSAVMRSIKNATGTPTVLTTQVFTESGADWILVYSDNSNPSALGNTQFSSEIANEFASAIGSAIKIYNVSPNGLTIKRDIVVSNNILRLAVNSKYVATEEQGSAGGTNFVVYSRNDGFPVFSTPASGMSLLLGGRFDFIEDVLVARSPLAPGPDGGASKGGVQVLIPSNDGYSWQTVYTYNGTSATRPYARIGTCALALSRGRVLFTEFVSDQAITVHLVSDGAPNVTPVITAGNIIAPNGKALGAAPVQLIEPHPIPHHTEKPNAFYYMWTDNPSNDHYIFHDIYPDTRSIWQCNRRAIASGPSDNTYSISRNDFCFAGTCYFIGFINWHRDCNGNPYRQTWEVTPVAGGLSGPSTGLYTFDR